MKKNYLIFFYITIGVIVSSILAAMYIAITGVRDLEIVIEEDNTNIEEEWNIFGKGPNNKVIFPDKSGYYKFNIINKCNKDMSVTITFSDDNPYQIPIVYHLYTSKDDLCGSDDNWVTVDELKKSLIINDKDELPITLEWKWASDDDTFDTMIGNQEDAYYTINVSITGRIK